MANLFKLTRDTRGNWRRQNLGLKPTETGDLAKATFMLGRDYAEACKRVVLLEQMWTRVEQDWHDDKQTSCPIWNAETYPIALAVARGESPIHLDMPDEDRQAADRYPDPETVVAVWIGAVRALFPFLDLRIKNEDAAATAEKGAKALAEQLEGQAEALKDTARKMRGTASGEMLHNALDAYSQYLKTRYGDSGWGRTQRNQTKMIKDHVEDQPLSMLTADRIEAVLSFFANRPTSKASGKSLAFFTCRNILITFRQFLRWLNRSEAWRWDMPVRFTFPRTKIKKLAADRIKKRRHFTRDELKLLWQYAMPWDRALMLLSLNCGFSKAEISTLQQEEIQTVKGESFVKRIRTKTDAYGEWLLWSETLEALAYLKRLHQGGTPYIVVSKTGKPLDKQTKGGNENQTIKNHWDRLLKRVVADYPDMPKLSFKCLRKSGANLVRKLAPKRATELASMYLSHGEKSDSADQLLPAYTERPWRLLHKVLRKLRHALLPVFESVKQPWEDRMHTITPLTRERIKALRAEGKTYQEIGEALALHWTTVGKLCRSEEKPSVGD